MSVDEYSLREFTVFQDPILFKRMKRECTCKDSTMTQGSNRESTRLLRERYEGAVGADHAGRKRRRKRQPRSLTYLGVFLCLANFIQAEGLSTEQNRGALFLRKTRRTWGIGETNRKPEKALRRVLDSETPERDVSPRPTPPPTPPPPTRRPTVRPSPSPTGRPTKFPTAAPSASPTRKPTLFPTVIPTKEPSVSPTKLPTVTSTDPPSPQPVDQVVVLPTNQPTRRPSVLPTKIPTKRPTRNPTDQPTLAPTRTPTRQPTKNPTASPSASPTKSPSRSPTNRPSRNPTRSPSETPTFSPTFTVIVPDPKEEQPTPSPTTTKRRSTKAPSRTPTTTPTENPTQVPTPKPTMADPVLVSAPVQFDATLRNIDLSSLDTELPRIASIWRNHIGISLQQKYGRRNVRDVVLTVTNKAEEESTTRRYLIARWLQVGSVEVEADGQADVEVNPTNLETDPLMDVTTFLDENILTEDSLEGALEASNSDVIVAGVQNARAPPSDSSGSPSIAEMVFGFLLLALVLASLTFWMYVLRKKRQKRIRKRQQLGVRKEGAVTVGPSPPQNDDRQAATRREGAAPVTTFPTKEDSSSGDESSYKGLRSDDSSTASDFGRELKEAASLDRAAWEEFQRKKKDLKTADSSARAATKELDMSMYSSLGSEDQGVEVLPVLPHLGTFPYGDENERGLNNTSMESEISGFRLSSDQAVQWGADGVALDVPELASTKFEPYGDSASHSRSRSLQESWDLDENPVRDGEGPQQYSFVHPLKSRDIGDQATSSPPGTDRSEDPTSAALNNSTSGTSWSASENTGSGNTATVMMQQVEELSQFVQKYDTRKEKRKERDLERQKRLSQQVSSTSNREGDTPDIMDYPPDSVATSESFDSVHSRQRSLDDDESSQRLGISRYSVEKPDAPAISHGSNDTQTRVQSAKEKSSKQKVHVIGTPDRDSDKGETTLHDLRSTTSVLDQSSNGAPSDEKSKLSGRQTPVGTARRDTASTPPRSPVPGIADSAEKRSPIRSTNKAFVDLFSKFENSPKKP